MANSLKIKAILCSGALVLGVAAAMPAAAFGQTADSDRAADVSVDAREADSRDGVRLNGGVRLPAAYDPIDVIVPELIAAPDTGDASGSASGPTAESAGARGLQAPDAEASASALPWFQRFTVAPAEPQILWTTSENFQMQAGDRWGVTVGYSQGERSPQSFELQDFRAGAFFELTERVRLGGQLRFTSPEEEIFGEETEDRAPEIRFESAFKF